MKFQLNLLNTKLDGTDYGSARFVRYYLRGGDWYLEEWTDGNKFGTSAGNGVWAPNGIVEYLCMGPANSACILDKT